MPNFVSRKGILLPVGAKNVRQLKPQDVDRLIANDNLNEALGPGTPLQPTPIDNTGMPRRFYFPPGVNLTPTPTNGRIDFQTLRDTSRLYGLLRKCIEIRKNEMTRLPWNIMPRRGTPKEKLALMRENRLKIRRMEDFFDFPDKERTWAEWLKSIIEDHLVIDAVAIYKRRTLGGKLYSLEQVDGVTIKVILDIRGRRPVPPNVAYQQVILGTPREDFTSEELIYALLTPVVDSPYGFCYDEETEILTREGWKLFADLRGDEEVATRSANKEFQWQLPTAYVHQPYSGQMFHFHSRSVDLLVTPEHRMLINSMPSVANGGKRRSRGAGEVLVPANVLAQGYNHGHKIPMTSTWEGVEVLDKTFALLPKEAKTVSRVWRGQEQTYTLPMGNPGKPVHMSGDDYCALLGAFLAEGSIFKTHGIEICQMERSKGYVAYAQLCARIMGADVYHTGDRFILPRRALRDHFAQFGHAHEKFIPEEVMNATPRQLRLFWDAYTLGDGSFPPRVSTSARGRKEGLNTQMTTVSAKLAGQLVEVAQKLGLSASVSTRPAAAQHTIQGVACRRREAYTVRVRYTPSMSFHTTETTYEGTIHCVTVPNGVVYVRRNGKPAWSGNSPVEQNLTLYNLCMRWLAWSTAVFTDGSIPQMMLTAPEQWTPDQISELMELRKAIRAGDPRAQRDLEMLPHGVEAIIQNGGQAYLEFSQEIVNFLIDQTCISMDVTRQELGLDPSNSQGLGGSGRADAQENVQYRRSLLPLSTWLSQSLFNPLLKEFGLDDFRWTWPTLTDLDPSAHTVLLKERVEAGLMTWDDALLELGQEPIGANKYFRINPGEAFLPEDLEQMHSAGGTAEYTARNEIKVAKQQGDLQLKQQKAQTEMQTDLQEQQAQHQQDQSQQEHGQGMEMEQHKAGLAKDQAEHQSDLAGQQSQQQAEQQTQATMQTNEHASGLKQQESDAQHQQELQKLQMGQEHEASQQEGQQQADQQGAQQEALRSQQEMAYQHQLSLAQASHGHGLTMEQQQATHGQQLEQQQAGAGQQLEQQEAGHGQQLEQQQAGATQALAQQEAGHGQQLEQQQAGAGQQLAQQAATHSQKLEQQEAGAGQSLEQQASGHDQALEQQEAQAQYATQQQAQGHAQKLEQDETQGTRQAGQSDAQHAQKLDLAEQGHGQELERAEQGQGHKERLAEQQAQIGANSRDRDNDGQMEQMYYGAQLQDYRDGKSREFEQEMAGSGANAKRKKAVKKGVEAEFDVLPPTRDQFFLVDSVLREVPQEVTGFLLGRGYKVLVNGGTAEADGVPVTTDFDLLEKTVTAFNGARRFGLLNTIGMALDDACGNISASPGFPLRRDQDHHRMFGIHFAGYLSNPALVRHQDPHIAAFMEALLRALRELHHGQ